MADPSVDPRRWLASPRGQLQLFGATFAVAAVIAVVCATQRPFFERYIREKHPTTSAVTQKLAEDLEQRPPGELSEADWNSLYQAFMQASGEEYRHVPRALARADRDRTRARLLRTWHAGSDAQRHRALAFVIAAGDPTLLTAIEEASPRSRPTSTEMSQALRDTRDALTDG